MSKFILTVYIFLILGAVTSQIQAKSNRIGLSDDGNFSRDTYELQVEASQIGVTDEGLFAQLDGLDVEL